MPTFLASWIAALAFAGCGADPAIEEHAPSPAAAATPGPTEQPTAERAPPAELAWMSEAIAPNAPASLALPPTFFAEDPRYRGLVPDGPVGVVTEMWSIDRGPVEHQYDASFRSAQRADYMRATSELLRGFGRTLPAPRDNATLDVGGEPQVSVIPILLDQESVRVVVWFREGTSREGYAAFVAALPEVPALGEALGLGGEPRYAKLTVSGEPPRPWNVEAGWIVDRAALERATAALAERGFTEGRGDSDDDPVAYWRREGGAPSITVMVARVADGFDVVIAVQHPAPR